MHFGMSSLSLISIIAARWFLPVVICREFQNICEKSDEKPCYNLNTSLIYARYLLTNGFSTSILADIYDGLPECVCMRVNTSG